MQSTFVLAQLEALPLPEDNLKKAAAAVEKAVKLYHLDFMLFPEVFMCHYPAGTDRSVILGVGEPLDGPFVKGMQKLAKENQIWMVFGMREKVEDDADDRNYNTTVMLNSQGEIVQSYRKTHLYDAFGYKESTNIKPGTSFFEPVETPFGKIGLFVCYEVRFPEVARDQVSKGADILIMPTAWVKGDLKSHHFRTLITARAIENTVFMLACDQCGPTYLGESVAVDPMGVPISCGNEREDLIPVHIDTDRIAEVRKKLPSFKDRKPEMYHV